MRVMLARHTDEVGFIIHHISNERLLYSKGIGGRDSVLPVGQRVWVHSKERMARIMGRKATHLQEEDERKKKPQLNDLLSMAATYVLIRASVPTELALRDVAMFQLVPA